uniref:Uncharacterized protein n=1 Tax=Eutreptiella gymnastica TaxID=73025 RepID=A0A7S4CNC0_9EUGL
MLGQVLLPCPASGVFPRIVSHASGHVHLTQSEWSVHREDCLKGRTSVRLGPASGGLPPLRSRAVHPELLDPVHSSDTSSDPFLPPSFWFGAPPPLWHKDCVVHRPPPCSQSGGRRESLCFSLVERHVVDHVPPCDTAPRNTVFPEVNCPTADYPPTVT